MWGLEKKDFTEVKTSVGISCHLGRLHFMLGCWNTVLPPPPIQLPANNASRKQQITVRVLGLLPHTWDTWTELWAPGFDLIQSLLLWAFWGSTTTQKVFLSL